MSDIYFLRNNQNKISFDIQVGTTGNAATNVSQRRTGNSVTQIATSSANENGSIPNTNLGVSADLVGSSLIVITHILCSASDNLDQVFDSLSMSVTLNGGLDSDQSYSILDSEKSEFTNTRSIVAMKAIKLQIQ